MREMNAEGVPRPEGVPDEQPVTAEALWCAHNTELMRFATVLVGPADAHDVVVDAFLRASEAILAGGIGNRRAYLFRSVYNGAAGRRRAQRRRAARELKALAPDTLRAIIPTSMCNGRSPNSAWPSGPSSTSRTGPTCPSETSPPNSACRSAPSTVSSSGRGSISERHCSEHTRHHRVRRHRPGGPWQHRRRQPSPVVVAAHCARVERFVGDRSTLVRGGRRRRSGRRWRRRRRAARWS